MVPQTRVEPAAPPQGRLPRATKVRHDYGPSAVMASLAGLWKESFIPSILSPRLFGGAISSE